MSNKKTRVVLINPKISSETIIKQRARPPISLGIISSILDKLKIKNELFDLAVKDYNIDYEIYSHLIITTSPLDRWETPYLDYREVFEIIKKAKNQNPLIKCIITGTHGTVTPQSVYEKSKYIDIIVRGEPETALKKYFQGNKKESIQGFFLKEGGEIIDNGINHTKDLDSLPFPNFSKFKMDKYSYNVLGKDKSFIVETSRGCPFNCTFCLKAMFPKSIKYRSIDNVIEELKILVNKYRIKTIYFQDLEFTINKERVKKICEKIIKNKLKFDWACASRANDCTNKLLKIMKKAGCKSISIGVESLSEKTLKKINKKITLKDIIKAKKLCERYEINFNSFTTCYPFESKEDIIETYRNSFKYNIPYKINPAKILPYPGTKIYHMLFPKKEYNWEEPKRFYKTFTRKMPIKAIIYFVLTKIRQKLNI